MGYHVISINMTLPISNKTHSTTQKSCSFILYFSFYSPFYLLFVISFIL